MRECGHDGWVAGCAECEREHALATKLLDEHERTRLNFTTRELDAIARLEAAQRELHEIADEIFLRRKGTKRAEREQYARRLNAIAASLGTVELHTRLRDEDE